MEYKDGWPTKFEAVSIPEQLCRIGRFVGSLLSVHCYQENTGGGPMLDRELQIREPADFSDDVLTIGINQMTLPYEDIEE